MKQMFTNLISPRYLFKRLRRGLEERKRFVESNISKGIAYQIRAMRENNGLTQEELAKKVGMNQNAIHRLENPNYGKPTITTLKRVAAAFDVALIVRFVPYSQLVCWVSGQPYLDNGLKPSALAVPSFADEEKQSAFSESRAPATTYLPSSRTVPLYSLMQMNDRDFESFAVASADFRSRLEQQMAAYARELSKPKTVTPNVIEFPNRAVA